MEQEQEDIFNPFEKYDNNILFRRWAATFIDYVVMILLLVLVSIITESLDSDTMPVIMIVIVLGYYIIMEAYLGATVGKFAVGIRVVDLNAESPGILKAIIRTATRILEVNPFLLGGLPAGIIVLTNKKRQRIGDMFAMTFVWRNVDVKKMRILIAQLDEEEVSQANSETEENK